MRKWFLKLIQKTMLQVDSNIRAGDLIRHRITGATFEAAGWRWTIDLQPRLFIQDFKTGQLFEIIYYQEYERIQDPGEIVNVN